jgi:hypothetical protein
MTTTIELCRTCGYEIPGDAPGCTACGPPVVPSHAARQVAGLALPTRSTHVLPTTRPAKVRQRRPLGRATVARELVAYTSLLVLLALAAALGAWAARLDRVVLEVPTSLAPTLERAAVGLAAAAAVGAALSAVAALVWCVRWTWRSLTPGRDDLGLG